MKSTKFIAVLIGIRSSEISLDLKREELKSTKKNIEFHRSHYGFFSFIDHPSFIIQEMKFLSMNLESIEKIKSFLDKDLSNIDIDLQNIPTDSLIWDIVRNTSKRAFDKNLSMFKSRISKSNLRYCSETTHEIFTFFKNNDFYSGLRYLRKYPFDLITAENTKIILEVEDKITKMMKKKINKFTKRWGKIIEQLKSMVKYFVNYHVFIRDNMRNVNHVVPNNGLEFVVSTIKTYSDEKFDSFVPVSRSRIVYTTSIGIGYLDTSL